MVSLLYWCFLRLTSAKRPCCLFEEISNGNSMNWRLKVCFFFFLLLFYLVPRPRKLWPIRELAQKENTQTRERKTTHSQEEIKAKGSPPSLLLTDNIFKLQNPILLTTLPNPNLWEESNWQESVVPLAGLVWFFYKLEYSELVRKNGYGFTIRLWEKSRFNIVEHGGFYLLNIRTTENKRLHDVWDILQYLLDWIVKLIIRLKAFLCIWITIFLIKWSIYGGSSFH